MFFFHPQESKWAGIEYCVMLVVVGFIGAICETHTYFHLNNAGIKMKTALISAIYRKSLKMLQPNGKLCRWRSDKFKSKLSNLHTYLSKYEQNSFLWENNFFETMRTLDIIPLVILETINVGMMNYMPSVKWVICLLCIVS